jgi:hypothetical protein
LQTTQQTFLFTRLSWARQTNSAVESRDFSGLTGSIAASYAATGKLSFNASLSRDAGINGALFNLDTNAPPSTAPTGTAPVPTTGLSQSSQVTNSLSFTANYAATAKINAIAGVTYRHAKLVDTITTGGIETAVESTDNSRLYSIGVSYAIARSWQFGCNFAHASRDLTGSGATAYSANTTSCSAQFTLR